MFQQAASSIILFCVLLIPGRAAAQQAASDVQQPLQVTTEMVQIGVSVLAAGGDFVSGLQRQNFRVLDGGVEQPLMFFAPTDAPAQILVMVETSPAVYLIQSQHIAAAYALLDGLAPDDQVALVTYDQAPRAVLAFTPDKSALLNALGQIQFSVGMGQLNFYDAVSTALDWIAPVSGKKALVLLTTGLDSSSPARWDALAQKLRARDVVIFPVALGGWLRRAPDKPDKKKKATAAPPQDSQMFAQADQALLSLRGDHRWAGIFSGVSEGFRANVSADCRSAAASVFVGNRSAARWAIPSADGAGAGRRRPAFCDRGQKSDAPDLFARRVSRAWAITRIIGARVCDA